MDKKKILRVLRKAGSLISGRLTRFKKTPERCSIGCLLHAAGVSDKEMRIDDYYLSRAYQEILYANYGMSSSNMCSLVAFNDSAVDSNFAKECNFRTPNTKGAQGRRNKARACIVIKEIQRM